MLDTPCVLKEAIVQALFETYLDYYNSLKVNLKYTQTHFCI